MSSVVDSIVDQHKRPELRGGMVKEKAIALESGTQS